MGVEENKALIRRFYEEVWGKGDPDVSAEVFHDDYLRHDLRAGAAEPGPAGQTKIALDFRRAIPDLDWHVDLVLGDGEFVVGRWTATGTHTGPWGAMAPTGRPISFAGGEHLPLRAGQGRRDLESPRRPGSDDTTRRSFDECGAVTHIADLRRRPQVERRRRPTRARIPSTSRAPAANARTT